MLCSPQAVLSPCPGARQGYARWGGRWRLLLCWRGCSQVLGAGWAVPLDGERGRILQQPLMEGVALSSPLPGSRLLVGLQRVLQSVLRVLYWGFLSLWTAWVMKQLIRRWCEVDFENYLTPIITRLSFQLQSPPKRWPPFPVQRLRLSLSQKPWTPKINNIIQILASVLAIPCACYYAKICSFQKMKSWCCVQLQHLYFSSSFGHLGKLNFFFFCGFHSI